MILFAAPSFASLAAQLQQAVALRHGHYTATRFPNDELHITVHTSVRGESCLLLGSVTPPDDNLLTMLLLAHTLKKAGAHRVIGVFPYLAYTRQDKDEPNHSMATAWLGNVLSSSGIDEIRTLDIHSQRALEVLGIPVYSLSPASLWAEVITQLGWHNATLVAPDAGAGPRCMAVAHAAGITTPPIILQKERTHDGVLATFAGQVNERVVVIDDILDTGGTLVACCEGLRHAGAKAIVVCVTHGLFTGNAWQYLWSLGVQSIFCTDSVPPSTHAPADSIVYLPVLPLLASDLAAQREASASTHGEEDDDEHAAA